MQSRVAFAVLAVVALSAGCASSVPEGLSELRRGNDAPVPWYNEWRASVGFEHNASYAIPVRAGAVALQVDLRLEQDPNLPSPVAITASLLDPAGAVLATRTVDARAPEASLGLTQFSAFGEYTLLVTGRGVSELPAGVGKAARYTAIAEVVYA